MSNEYLEHYGVPGMKWGVRKIKRMAKKDAKEHEVSRLYYGEGSRTRRKLLKAKIEERLKNPIYKQYYDEYLKSVNTEDAAIKAQKQRTSADIKKRAGVTARGIYHTVMGDGAKVAASVAAGAAAVSIGVAALKKTGYDKVLINKGKQVFNTAINKIKSYKH